MLTILTMPAPALVCCFFLGSYFGRDWGKELFVQCHLNENQQTRPCFPRWDLAKSLWLWHKGYLLKTQDRQVSKVLVKKSTVVLNSSVWVTRFPQEVQDNFVKTHCIWPHSSSTGAVFNIGKEEDEAFFEHSAWSNRTVAFHPGILSKSCTLCAWVAHKTCQLQ